MNEVVYIFKSNGFYLGFMTNGNIFSRDGVYLGWVEGNFVWDSVGQYRGQLMISQDKYYILRNTYSVSPIPKSPRVPPTIPALPAPPANIPPITLSIGLKDGF